jgi:hypothetical protein
LRVPERSRPAAALAARTAQQVSDEVELYHRTYTTLLRSERRDAAARARAVAPLDELEPARRLAGSEEARPRRVPVRDPAAARRGLDARVIVMGQEARSSRAPASGRSRSGRRSRRRARRRRWFDDGTGTMAVLLASASDLDDLIPTLVAYQIEWNKLPRCAARGRLPGGDARPGRVRRALGGAEDDWLQLARRGATRSASPREVAPSALNLRDPDARRLRGRLRAHDAPLVGARARDDGRAGARRPADVLRLLQPALARNLVSGTRGGGREDEVTAWLETAGPDDPARRARPRSATVARAARGELPLLLGARLLRGAAAELQRGGARGGARGSASRHLVAAPRCGSRRR